MAETKSRPRYSIYVEKEQEKERTALKIYHNKKLESKFDLEVIDRYSSQFKDQNQFLTYLAKIDVLHFIPMKCFIGYNANGKLEEKDIIYNDHLINTAAKDIIFQKKQGIKHDNIFLTQTDDIVKFSNEIINLAINDINAFESMQKKKKFPMHVLDLLFKYKYPPETYTQDDMHDLKEQIKRNMLLYPNFRTIYLWKQEYDKALIEANNNKISEEPKENRQMELYNYKTFNVNNKHDTTNDHKETNEKHEDHQQPDTPIDDDYENKRDYILYIYKIYGVDGVKNLFDNDDIAKYLTESDIQTMELYNQDQEQNHMKL